MPLFDRFAASPAMSRRLFNLWPCFRRTGARVRSILPDWSEVRVDLPFNLRTRNYVGTMFGGAMYAAVDPFLMVMLMHRLGRDYVVWDKAATIRFREPARSDLHVTFRIDDAELAAVRDAVAAGGGRTDRTYSVDLVNSHGEICATVEKVLYIATSRVHTRRAHERARARTAARLGSVVAPAGSALKPRPASPRVRGEQP